MLPEQLEKQFQLAIETALEKKIRIAHETKEEKIERLMNELGIEGSTFSMLSQLIRYDAEVKQEFISNIIFGVVFGAIGIFLYYFQYKKSIHNDR